MRCIIHNRFSSQLKTSAEGPELLIYWAVSSSGGGGGGGGGGVGIVSLCITTLLSA